MELNKIYNMDCVEGIKQIPDSTIDIVIADPPYNISKNFGNNNDNLPTEEYVEWSLIYIHECMRTLKKTGTMYIYGFPEIIQHVGIKLSYSQKWLCWHYTNKTVPSLNFWQRSFETIIAICKDDKKVIFNRDDVREEYTDVFLRNSAGKKRKGTKGRFSNGSETIYNANIDGALPRDVIKIPALAGGAGAVERFLYCKECDILVKNNERDYHKDHALVEHPTQKPLALGKKLIMASKPKDSIGTVLVPFCGTSSECIAAKSLGQNFISFELNPDYILLAERLLKHYGF